jgi:predicted transcriptional regulator of viral defense system
MFNMMSMQNSLTHPRLERQRKLFQLADSQRGYFTAAQARALGFAYQVQQHHRENGSWLSHNELRGVYRLRDYPDDALERLVQVSLWSHDRHGKTQAVIGFESALSVHGIGGLLPARIHLIVPLSFRKSPLRDVILHRDQLDENDYDQFTGFAVTRPLRTLVDVAGSALSPEHLETAVRDALEYGRVRRGTLEERVSSLTGRSQERLRAALEAQS